MSPLKVAKIDITPSVVGMIGGAALLLMVAIWQVLAGAPRRAIGAAATELREGLQSGVYQKINAGARGVARYRPKIELDLMRAAAAYRVGKSAEARKIYKKVLKKGKKKHQAIALVALGAIEMMAAKDGEQAAAAKSATSRFEKAIRLSEGLGDAYANLGTAKLILEQYDEAAAQFQKALDARIPPTRDALGNTYNGLGVLHAVRGDAKESARRFTMAKAMSVRVQRGGVWKAPEDNLKAARLNMVTQMNLPEIERRKVLNRARQERWVTLFPKQIQYDINVRLGLGAYYIRDLGRMKWHFNAAIKMDPLRADVYLRWASLLWLQMQKPYADAKTSAERRRQKDKRLMVGVGNPWKVEPGAPVGSRRSNAREPTGFSQAVRLRKDWEKHLVEALTNSPLSDEMRWRINRVIAHVLLFEASLYWRDAAKAKAAARKHIDAMVKIKPDDAEGLRLQALMIYEASQALAADKQSESPDFRKADQMVAEALGLLRKSFERDDSQADLRALLDGNKRKVEITDFRPSGGIALSSRPIISSAVLGVPLEELKKSPPIMMVDGTVVRARLLGHDLFYRPPAPLADGAHRVHVSYKHTDGKTLSSDFLFAVDNAPPTISLLDPPFGTTLRDVQPSFTIAYADKGSGIAISSLVVELRPVGGTAIFTDSLIKGGVYDFSFPGTPRFMRGDAVGEKQTVVASRHRLKPGGTYQITVKVSDNRGNRKMANFKITIDPATVP